MLKLTFPNLPEVIPFLGWTQAKQFSKWKEFIWQSTEKTSYVAIKNTAELQHMLQTQAYTYISVTT